MCYVSKTNSHNSTSKITLCSPDIASFSCSVVPLSGDLVSDAYVPDRDGIDPSV